MKKIVVKIGSSVLAPQGKFEPKLINDFVGDIVEVQNLGYRIILVTSGAIACGANALKIKRRPEDAHSLMAIASLGQIILMDTYEAAFKKYEKLCAQILLTWDDFDNRKRFLNARATVDKLLAMGVIPIINENDAVSSDEIKFGDNDRLSALVADLTRAEKLIILSDVEGLIGEDGKVKDFVEKVDAKIYKLIKTKTGDFTSGGMVTKLQAAEISALSGVKLIIASGREEKVISRIVKGEHIGTMFYPAVKIERARKRWIAFSKKIKGKIWIDDGAKEAILKKGRSLLAVGIIKAEGDFKKKDAVCVVDKEGNILGCGLVNYFCDELIDCKGKKFEKEIIHRDNFVKKE
ncbi:MAG: glutamate 5-kinase [Candidatus Omnitrophota bacterium]|nr:glutamate 5-kinase [Candidatus Omnitrophota bacterium]